MGYNQWGQWVPDYNNGYTASNVNNYNNYREELLRQQQMINARLADFDTKYPPQQPSQQVPQEPYNISNVQSQDNISKQSYIIVTNEKEARDYPIVKKIDDEIGKVYFFVTNDENTIFVKRINPSTFDLEFETYTKITKSENAEIVSNNDGELLRNIDGRLEKIEQFIEFAGSMLLNSGTSQVAPTDSSKTKSGKQTSSDKTENSEVK